MTERPLRLFYAIGPGDVVTSYRQWASGGQVLSETSRTFSGQFFDFCRKHGHVFYAVSSCARAEKVKDGPAIVENRPKRLKGEGWRFHVAQFRYALGLMRTALAWRADAVIADSGTTHWILLAPLRLFGIRIVGCLHNVPWPNGYAPTAWTKRLVLRSDGWFWRSVADGLIAVSPECERQVRSLAGRFTAPAVQFRAQYQRHDFADVKPPPPVDVAPFRVVFAGRIERNKGVLDLVDIAKRLEEALPGRVVFDVCGGGPALGELEARTRAAALQDVIRTHGKLDRPALLAVYSASHLVIVPTRSDFCEGMPMVCAEAILCGRPVLTSRLSNALDVLTGAVVEATPDDPESYADAIRRLVAAPAEYERFRAACQQHQDQFYDGGQGLTGALERIFVRTPRAGALQNAA